MKKTLFALVLLLGVSAFGQTILTNTTLGAAVTTTGGTTIVVASATGISAPSPNTGNVYGSATSQSQSYLYVDRELMEVRGVSGTTITVVRGAGSTAAVPHANGAFVFVVPANMIYGGSIGAAMQSPAAPAGACTRTNEVYLPRIEFASGTVTDCLNGQWVNGSGGGTMTAAGAIQAPTTGGTAYSSLETNGTAFDAATSMYCTEVAMPYDKALTGLKYLAGTTAGGTEKKTVVLYDGGGNVLAHGAAAGVTNSTASVYVAVPFTAPYYAVGPARYFACLQSNGTSDTVRHTITGVQDYLLAGKVTGQTFGTFATATMPSTFTTATGPYFLLY